MGQARNVSRHQPVVLIQKEQQLTVCRRHCLGGGLSWPQRCVRLKHSQGEGATSQGQRRMAGLHGNNDHFDALIGLQGHGVQRLRQMFVAGTANKDRNQGQDRLQSRALTQHPRRDHIQLIKGCQLSEFFCCQHPIRLRRLHVVGQGVAAILIQCANVAQIVLLIQLRCKASHRVILEFKNVGDVQQCVRSQGRTNLIKCQAHGLGCPLNSGDRKHGGLSVIRMNFPG